MNEFFNFLPPKLRKYLDLNGRATRKEYWYFILFATILFIGAKISDNRFLIIFIDIFVILPLSIPISVRRLHDIGKSGWWYLATFIPLIGFIIWIIWFFRDSQPGENQYGPNPEEIMN